MPKLVQIEPMLPYIAWPLGESGEDLLAVERENAKLKLELEELRTELEKNRSRLDLMRDLLTPAKKTKARLKTPWRILRQEQHGGCSVFWVDFRKK